MANAVISAYNAADPNITTGAITQFSGIGDGNVAIIYGVNIAAYRQGEIIRSLNQCRDALIQRSTPAPLNVGDFMTARMIPDAGKRSIDLVEYSPAATIGENHVYVSYGDAFMVPPGGASLNLTTTVNKLIEKLLDDVFSKV